MYCETNKKLIVSEAWPGFFKEGVCTLCQSEGTHQIVMSFSPPVVGCLFGEHLQKGGVAGTSGSPLATPLWVDTYCAIVHCENYLTFIGLDIFMYTKGFIPVSVSTASSKIFHSVAWQNNVQLFSCHKAFSSKKQWETYLALWLVDNHLLHGK